MNPEYKTIEFNGKRYVYHYSLITAEMAETVREIAEFKATQDEVQATDVNQLLRSGGTVWRLMCARYLIREVINDTVQVFDYAKAETEVYKWIKSLPDELFDTFISESLRDFFTVTKRAHLISALFPSEKRMQRMSPLLMSLMMNLNGMKNAKE